MSAKIKLTMDDAEVQKSLDEQRKKNESVETSYVAVAKQILKNEKQAVNAGKRIIKSQRDEKQILADKIKQLRTLGQTDKSQKSAANAAIKKLIGSERERQAAIEETERTGTEAYQALQTQISKGVAKTKELIAAEKTLDSKYDELKGSITAAFRAGKIGADEHKTSLKLLAAEQTKLKSGQDRLKKGNPFGGEVLGQVKSYAAGVLSVTAAITAVRTAYQEFQAEVQRGRDQTISSRDARTSLLQVSDESNFSDRLSRVDSASVKFGVDRNESAKVLFDAISNGVEKDFEDILRADRVIPAEIGAKFAGEFRKQFEKEGLTAAQSLNLALAAAGSSKFNVQEIQPQIRTAAAGAGNLPGVDSSDVAALVSQNAIEFGERTGNTIKGLLSNFGAKRLELLDAQADGKDSPEVQKAIGILGQSAGNIIGELSKPENRDLKNDIIGDNKQLLNAFSAAVKNLGKTITTDRTIEAEVKRAGTEDSLISKRLRAFFSDPRLKADVVAEQKKIQRDIDSESAFSEEKALIDSRRDEVQADINASDSSRLGKAARGFVVARILDLQEITGLGLKPDLDRQRRSAERGIDDAFFNGQKEAVSETRKQTKEVEKQTKALEDIAKSNREIAKKPGFVGVD